MKNSVVKLLTLAALSLLINVGTAPANAATPEQGVEAAPTEPETRQLPDHMKEWAVIGAAGLVGIAVMLGTGNSIKHDKKGVKDSRVNKGIKRPRVRS